MCVLRSRSLLSARIVSGVNSNMNLLRCYGYLCCVYNIMTGAEKSTSAYDKNIIVYVFIYTFNVPSSVVKQPD